MLTVGFWKTCQRRTKSPAKTLGKVGLSERLTQPGLQSEVKDSQHGYTEKRCLSQIPPPPKKKNVKEIGEKLLRLGRESKGNLSPSVTQAGRGFFLGLLS